MSKTKTYRVGDCFMLEGTGDFSDGIRCMVIKISDDGKRILKAKAVQPDDRLATLGFIIEGDDYIIIDWELSEN